MEEQIIRQLTKISTIQKTTYEDLKEIKDMLKEQNGRVRKNETAIERLNTIAGIALGSAISYVAWILGFKQ